MPDASQRHPSRCSQVRADQGRVDDLEKALGQYVLYHDVLSEREPDRALYLAIAELIMKDVFEEPIGQLLLKKNRLQLLVFNPEREEILRWVRWTQTEK